MGFSALCKHCDIIIIERDSVWLQRNRAGITQGGTSKDLQDHAWSLLRVLRRRALLGGAQDCSEREYGHYVFMLNFYPCCACMERDRNSKHLDDGCSYLRKGNLVLHH